MGVDRGASVSASTSTPKASPYRARARTPDPSDPFSGQLRLPPRGRAVKRPACSAFGLRARVPPSAGEA